jgi:hypothetical protein
MSTVPLTRVLRDNLGLREYARERVLHDLTEAQTVESLRLSGSPLQSICLHEDTEFKGLVTQDKSCVCYRCQETIIYFDT